MTEIDYIRIQREGVGKWVLYIENTDDYYGGTLRFTIGDPSQFLDETQRVLGTWVAEDRLTEAMYAIPPEPQSIRADLEENV